MAIGIHALSLSADIQWGLDLHLVGATLVRLPEVPSVSVRGLRVLLDDGSDMRIDVLVNMRDTTHDACRLNSFPGALRALLSCFVSFLPFARPFR